MLTASLLHKKRRGEALTDEEIEFLIDGFCRGDVADYQMSALAMAICLRGMDEREVTSMTRSMLASGERFPRRDDDDRPRVDKHSTGGLGDKVSLVLAPLLACCGMQVPMISGRGLGLTGGTLDKLESIEGFRTQLSFDESDRVLAECGAFIVGASDRVAPADQRLYALRDVTGTVDSVPLITASILSKKLAASLDALVMDVKVGHGGFMSTMDDARELARSLIRVGGQAGLPTTAILSDMDQPLGEAVGNALEVNEAVTVLDGGGPEEVVALTVELGANLLLSTGLASTRETARDRLNSALASGSARERFEQIVHAQGGRPRFPLKVAPPREITASQDGFIESIDCQAVGEEIVSMGGGRRQKNDRINPSVGVRVHVRIGDSVSKGQPLLNVHGEEKSDDASLSKLKRTVRISEKPVDRRPLVLQIC